MHYQLEYAGVINIFKGPILWKHVFSGLDIYKLVLPEPSNSAAHPLVKQCSYRLFRFSSFRYVTKRVIIIVPPPLRGDRRYLRGGAPIPEVKFGVSSGKIAVFRNVVAQS